MRRRSISPSPGLVALAAAAAVAALVSPVGAWAQEGDEPQEGTGAPEIAEAPRQFHLGLTGSALLWEDAEERSPANTSLWGASVERILLRYLSVRADGAVGSNRIRGATDSVDATTYVAEVLLAARIAPPALERAGIVPFLAGGIGTVVHDPDRDGLATASQNALSWGIGLEVAPLDRFGFRAEWRRYDVDLEDLFDPLDRTGASRRADRFQATAFWTF